MAALAAAGGTVFALVGVVFFAEQVGREGQTRTPLAAGALQQPQAYRIQT